jgi:FkbM family methyltransferase
VRRRSEPVASPSPDIGFADRVSPGKLGLIHLSIANAQRMFFFREGSASDRAVINQVMVQRCYDLRIFRQSILLGAYYTKLIESKSTPLIIDAGANIGASTLWFASNFPGSRVVAIEPEESNCQILRRNCDGLNVSLMEGAIGSHGGHSFLHDPGGGEWSYQVRPDGKGKQVTLYSAAGIVADCKASGVQPFLCKIDIEGGEADLFRDNTAWVSEFAVIVIELHDWLFPGTSNSRNFRRAISDLDADFVYRGENVFVFNHGIYA